MAPRPTDQSALFMAVGADVQFALRCGLGWDGAIAALKDQIARLETLRDRDIDPKKIVL